MQRRQAARIRSSFTLRREPAELSLAGRVAANRAFIVHRDCPGPGDIRLDTIVVRVFGAASFCPYSEGTIRSGALSCSQETDEPSPGSACRSPLVLSGHLANHDDSTNLHSLCAGSRIVSQRSLPPGSRLSHHTRMRSGAGC